MTETLYHLKGIVKDGIWYQFLMAKVFDLKMTSHPSHHLNLWTQSPNWGISTPPAIFFLDPNKKVDSDHASLAKKQDPVTSSSLWGLFPTNVDYIFSWRILGSTWSTPQYED